MLLSLCLTPGEGLCSSLALVCPSALRLNPRKPGYLSQQIPGPTPFHMELPALLLWLLFTEPLCVPTTTLPRPAPSLGVPGDPHHTHTHNTQPSLLQHLGELSLVSFFPLPLLPSFSKDLLVPTLPGAGLYVKGKSDRISPTLWAPQNVSLSLGI